MSEESSKLATVPRITFTRLYPGQISTYWDQIRFGIEQSFPVGAPRNERVFGNVLAGLMDGSMQCWMGRTDGNKVLGSVVTGVSEDKCLEVTNLLIYSLFWGGKQSDEDWEHCLSILREFARKCGCHKIIGFTQNPMAVGLAKKLGGTANTVMIELEV